MKVHSPLVMSVMCAGLLSAQSTPPSSPVPLGGAESIAKLEQEMFVRSARGGTAQLDRQLAERKAAAERQRLFYYKVEHFVSLWQVLAVQMNGQQTFDVKLARKVSKAFHELEKTDGWGLSETKPERTLTLAP